MCQADWNHEVIHYFPSNESPKSYHLRNSTYPYHPCMVYLPTSTIFYHLKKPNVGKYAIPGWYGIDNQKHPYLSPFWHHFQGQSFWNFHVDVFHSFSSSIACCSKFIHKNTPLKINMEHVLMEVWKILFFLNGWFVGSTLIFQGCILFQQNLPNKSMQNSSRTPASPFLTWTA